MVVPGFRTIPGSAVRFERFVSKNGCGPKESSRISIRRLYRRCPLDGRGVLLLQLVKIADALAFVISFCFVTLAGVEMEAPSHLT